MTLSFPTRRVSDRIAWIILSRRPKTLPTALDSQVEVLALTRCARFAAQSLTRWSSKMERSKSWLHGSRFSHPLPLQSTGDTSGIACEIRGQNDRSEEHTSELQSLMRISYAVFCLKKKKNTQHSL